MTASIVIHNVWQKWGRFALPFLAGLEVKSRKKLLAKPRRGSEADGTHPAQPVALLPDGGKTLTRFGAVIREKMNRDALFFGYSC